MAPIRLLAGDVSPALLPVAATTPVPAPSPAPADAAGWPIRGAVGPPEPVPGTGSREPPALPRADLSFDGKRAYALLVQQVAMGPRVPGSEGHRRTGDWIAGELGRWVDRVAEQRWSQPISRGVGAGPPVPMRNLFGYLQGAVAKGVTEPPDLMLCAHWDTRPIADRDPDPARRPEPVPGANDGASGVAVLLELARVLAGRRPARSVAFAFFDGEDLGEHFYGSQAFARVCHRREARAWCPRRAIVVDMVGRRGIRLATEAHSVQQAPALWNEVHEAARALGLSWYYHGPARAIGDDHRILNQAGIPAILLIDPADPAWHTTGDTPERCSADSLAVVGRVLEVFCCGVAATGVA